MIYKLGYLEGAEYRIKDIVDVIEKYKLDLELQIIKDYTQEECDLVIYVEDAPYAHEEYYEKFLTREIFKQAKGNPKFLMIFHGEYHSTPYSKQFWDFSFYTSYYKPDSYVMRTLQNFIPYESDYKCYGINHYEDTLHNCYVPYCIGDLKTIIDLYNTGEIQKKRSIKKSNFCSLICSHGSREREYIYQNLNEYKRIRCFGNYHKNMGNVYYDDDILLKKIMPTYKFNICFENTHSDYNEGYITEKICHAFMAGTIPIYWGNNIQIYDIFNKDAFINLTDVPCEEWVSIIKKYDEDADLYNKMLNTKPIVNDNVFDIFENKRKNFIKRVLTEKNY